MEHGLLGEFRVGLVGLIQGISMWELSRLEVNVLSRCVVDFLIALSRALHVEQLISHLLSSLATSPTRMLVRRL